MIDYFNSKEWRLIPIISGSGKLQMAIDEWLLEQHRHGKLAPTLRFYVWEPAAISLGYHQRQWPEFWQELTWQGQPLNLVRRPTGGRAVLHQGDLTYAIITSGLPENRCTAYRQLCQFLITGWRSLGVELQYGSTESGYMQNPNCFGTSTTADLILPDGTKLIGSAQLRRNKAILQHGSIRLNPDPKLFHQVFGVDSPAPQFPHLPQGNPLIQIVVDALVAAARHEFGVELIPQPLSEVEWQQILL